MARYFIKNARFGADKGGSACGPMCGPVVAEIEVKSDDGEIFYMSLAEVDGIPNFFKSEKPMFEMHLDSENDDVAYFTEHFIDTGDYFDIYRYNDDEFFPIYRYLMYLVRSNDNLDEFVENSTEKYLDEITVPKFDLDEEYDEDDFEIPEAKLDEMRVTCDFDEEFDPDSKQRFLSGIPAYTAEIKILDEGHEIYVGSMYVNVTYYDSEIGLDSTHYATTESIFDIEYVYNMTEKGDVDTRDRILRRGISEVFPEANIEERYAELYKRLDDAIIEKIEAEEDE